MFRASSALGVDDSGKFLGLMWRTIITPERCMGSNFRCILLAIAAESLVPSGDAPYRVGTRHRHGRVLFKEKRLIMNCRCLEERRRIFLDENGAVMKEGREKKKRCSIIP